MRDMPDRTRSAAVSFANSCAPAVQAEFGARRGDAAFVLVRAGEKAFRDVLAKDPGCAIATWGIASILMSNPLAGQGASPKGAEQAQAAIDEGRRIGAEDRSASATTSKPSPPTTRTSPTAPSASGRSARAKAYEALAQRYPDDDEAQIFCALYIAGTQSQADQTYAAYLEGGGHPRERVREVPRPSRRRALPDPQLRRAADRRAGACRRRGATPAIAPDAPHALHMPSHIFTRVGAWAGVGRDQRALACSCAMTRQRARRGLPRHRLHGVRGPAARPRRRGAPRDGRRDRRSQVTASPRFVVAYADRRDAGALCLRARRLGRRGEAAAADGRQLPFTEAITWFARGAGRRAQRRRRRGRAGRRASSRRCSRRCSPRRTPTGPPRSRSSGCAAAAWIAFAARTSRRGAAAHARGGRPRGPQREAHRHAGPHRAGARAAGRHAAGGRPAGGGAEGVRGVAAARAEPLPRLLAARRARRKRRATAEKAAAYYRKLLALAENADTPRPEIVQAKAFLAK